MPQHVHEHARRAVGGDVAEPVVIVLLVLVADVAEIVEEVAGEQAHADAQLQHEDLVFQRSRFLRFDQVGEEDLGGIARQGAVVVDDERHRRGIADERLVAALAQILLAQFPFERLGQRTEILHDVARSLGALPAPARRWADWDRI